MSPRPNWLALLPDTPPDAAACLQAVKDAYPRDHVPLSFCSCMDPHHTRPMTAAARQVQAGKVPAPQDFAQIYFEHPECIGGIEVIQQFMPVGIELMLTGTPPPGFGNSMPNVLDRALAATCWYWPWELITVLRPLAARLFFDWFEDARYPLKGLPWKSDDGLFGSDDPGEEIVQLCGLALLDPADWVARLVAMENQRSDDVLAHSNITIPYVETYTAADTGQNGTHYKDAMDHISSVLEARAAAVMLERVTPEWLGEAFFRNAETAPQLAQELSDFLRDYWVHESKLIARINRPQTMDWPTVVGARNTT